MFKAMLKLLWNKFAKELDKVSNPCELVVWFLVSLFLFLIFIIPNMLFMVLGLTMVKNFKSIGMFVNVTDKWEVTYFYWWSESLGRRIDLFRVLWDGYDIRRELVSQT